MSSTALRTWGGYSHTWAWYGGSAVMTPFWRFSIRLGPYFHDLIDPVFQQKKLCCLYHV